MPSERIQWDAIALATIVRKARALRQLFERTQSPRDLAAARCAEIEVDNAVREILYPTPLRDEDTVVLPTRVG